MPPPFESLARRRPTFPLSRPSAFPLHSICLRTGGWFVAPIVVVDEAGGALVETELSDWGPRAGRAASLDCASCTCDDASALRWKPHANAAPAGSDRSAALHA